MTKEKKCSCCQSILPLSAFHRDKGNPDGRQSKCRDCRSVYYRHGNVRGVLPLDVSHLDETLESILDEIQSDIEKISEAEKKGYKTEPRIEDICTARIKVFEGVLDDLFGDYRLKEKVLKNGIIKRVDGKIIIIPVKATK